VSEKDENGEYSDPRLTEEIVLKLVEDGIIDAEDSTITFYAGWTANDYFIDYIETPDGNTSSMAYPVSPTIAGTENNNGMVTTTYTRLTNKLNTFKFDTQNTLLYLRLGYEYKGYSFVNYNYEDYKLLNRNFAETMALDSTNAIANGNVYLYTGSIETEYNQINAPERLGDNEKADEHYIIVYVVWETNEYSIDISLNTFWSVDSQRNNFASPDAAYKVQFGDLTTNSFNIISELANNAAYAGYNGQNVKFKLRFGSKFNEAIANVNGTNYSLHQMLLRMTGYTYKSLNTSSEFNPDGDGIDLLQIGYGESFITPSYTLDSNDNYWTLDYNMMMQLYYHSVIDNGGDLSSSVTALRDLFKVGSNTIEVTMSENLSENNAFTLFGRYSTNLYTVDIDNKLDQYDQDFAQLSGLYHLTNAYDSATNYGFENYKIDSSVQFFTDEKLLIVPKTAGKYLSKVYLTYSVDSVVHIVTIEFKFNTTTRLVEVQNIYLDGVIQPDKENFRINYVFDNIGIETCSAYNAEFVTTLSKPFTYVGVPVDVNYIVLNIENLKSNVYLECEYEVQTFVPTVCVSITGDGSLRVTIDKDGDNITLSSTISDTTPYPYGTSILTIISKWENLLQNSGTCTKEGWYEVEIKIAEDGTAYMSNYFDLDISGILNRNIYICAKYVTNNPEDSKAVYFYTWDGDENGRYVEFIYNKYYILQTVYHEYIREEVGEGVYNEHLETHKLGYIYNTDLHRFVWDDTYSQNAMYYADGSYTVDPSDPTKLLYAKLSELPNPSTMGSPYPDTQFICYLVFDQLLIESLKDAAGNALNITTINEIVNQNVYARVINYYTESGVLYADVEFVGVGSLAGATLEKVEVLSTSTEIDQNLYVLQGYSSIQFTIETDEETEGSGNFKNDNIILDSASNNLKIHEDYLDSVTFFDIDNSKVVYYSPNNGDFVKLVVLSPAQYQAFLYAKAVYSLDTTALSSVLSTYGADIVIHTLKPDVGAVEGAFDDLGYYTVTNMNKGYYAFMFYYNHNAGASIVTICDTYMKNDNGVLKYYPTENNLAFTTNSVSATVGFNESDESITDPTKTYVV
ncbi:MAG: hypothetical protein IJA23_01110, partial [Clostridia bacterium]|nr:hypothetical protein [Clostridia bacterium]